MTLDSFETLSPETACLMFVPLPDQVEKSIVTPAGFLVVCWFGLKWRGHSPLVIIAPLGRGFFQGMDESHQVIPQHGCIPA
jgi:hypothetical protein